MLSALVTCDQVPISAAVWSICPNVQVLSAALPLFWHHTDTKMHVMAAHHFGALRNALRLLEQCYDAELSNKMPSTQLTLNLEFPYHLLYICINTSSVHHFRYLSHMDDSKLLFAAKAADGERICVKFACHYLKDVHNFCASKGFTLTLEGFEVLPNYYPLMDFPTPYSHYDDIIAKLADSSS